MPSLLGDAWHGRGAFARLAEMSRWRVVLVEVALLAIVCGGFYLLRCQTAAENYRSRLTRTSNELQAAVIELESERRALDTAQRRFDVLSGLVLDKDARARLLSELTTASAHPGLEFLSVSPQPDVAAGERVRCRVLLALSGSFEDFARFLRSLEGPGTSCAVLQVEIESRWNSGRPERFSLLIETYGEAEPGTSQTRPVR